MEMGWRKLEVIKNRGFTIIELMITILIFSVIIASVYATHLSQQKTYKVQDQIAEMQQNIRAALSLITTEIRMAGYDPTENAGAGITIASVGRLQLTLDIDGNGALGDPKELIDIGFSPTIDSTGDGIPDADVDLDGVPDAASLGKQTNGVGGYLPIADNIQAVEFRYLNAIGNVAVTPSNIRSIQITILARASRSIREFTNTMIYTRPSGLEWGPFDDNFHRRMLTTTILCRNLGI